MPSYRNTTAASSTVNADADAIVNAHNPKAELQRLGTMVAHGIRKQELPMGAVYELELAARRAGLSEPEIKAALRTAFHHARCGVIRTGRRRREKRAVA